MMFAVCSESRMIIFEFGGRFGFRHGVDGKAEIIGFRLVGLIGRIGIIGINGVIVALFHFLFFENRRFFFKDGFFFKLDDIFFLKNRLFFVENGRGLFKNRFFFFENRRRFLGHRRFIFVKNRFFFIKCNGFIVMNRFERCVVKIIDIFIGHFGFNLIVGRRQFRGFFFRLVKNVVHRFKTFTFVIGLFGNVRCFFGFHCLFPGFARSFFSFFSCDTRRFLSLTFRFFFGFGANTGQFFLPCRCVGRRLGFEPFDFFGLGFRFRFGLTFERFHRHCFFFGLGFGG